MFRKLRARQTICLVRFPGESSVPIINESTATEVANAARAMRNVAKDVAVEQVKKRKTRLRSSSKTRKSVATRERIMTATSELMVERGNTDFQMSEVSARCHMSKGALYYYFADKDELIQAIFASSSEDLVAAIERAVSEAPTAREAFANVGTELVRRLGGGSPLSLALAREVGVSKGSVLPVVSDNFARTIRIIAAQLERAKTEGVVRPDVDSQLAAMFMAGGFMVSSLAAVPSQDSRTDCGSFADALMDLSIRGVGVGQGCPEGSEG